MYSNRSDIDSLFVTATQSLSDMEASYQSLLSIKEIPDTLLLQVKEVLSNLKSALDFKSNEMSKHNFPIRTSEKDLEAVIKNFPQGYQQLLLSLKPYEGWWTDFNELNNKNKHVALVPQKRTETAVKSISHGQVGIQLRGGASIQIGSGASISLGGATIPGGQTIRARSPVYGDSRLIVKDEIWVDLLFDNSNYPNISNNISVLPFLKQCFQKVALTVAAMERLK